jgi:hypothetical protein
MRINIKILFVFTIVSCSADSAIIENHSDKDRIENHLTSITKIGGYRNYQNINALNYVADYIRSEFIKYCDTVYFQYYTVDNIQYKNVIGSIGTNNKTRIVVGAHYDVCGDQEGADDNASGVVGLLELARLLKDKQVKYRIDFVAYSLEEPPYFRTQKMGSYIHAKSLNDSNVSVKGMICLEMIGYFSEEPKSQDYPLPHKKLIYGDEADFIMIVQKMDNNLFANEIKNLMKHAQLIDTKSIKAPSLMPGIDFSDHMNYWEFGYSALMITNTAFYRNQNYHEASDKMETLELDKMASVIDEVYYAITNIK